MATKFKIGDAVKQVIAAPIAGVVQELSFNGSDIQCAVEITDDHGEVRHVYFTEDQLEKA